jgi:hypothetical protein
MNLARYETPASLRRCGSRHDTKSMLTEFKNASYGQRFSRNQPSKPRRTSSSVPASLSTRALEPPGIKLEGRRVALS